MPDAPLPSNPAPDRERLDSLVEATARQDRAAFAEIFEFYAPRVKAYLMRLNASDSLAEELTQEIMLTVWRKASQFDRSQASASTWIFRIARNRRIDAARQASKPALDAEDPALRPPEATAPDEAVHNSGRDERVRDAMQDLPQEQIALLRLAFFDGLSHRDIADKIGMPLGTVKSHVNRGRAKLQAYFHEAEETVA